MDPFIIMIVLIAIAGVVLNVLFWGGIAFFFVSLFKGIARNTDQFQGMSLEQQLATLMYLQQKGQIGRAQQYWGSVEGPVQSELGSLAASQGWDPSFLN